MYSVGSVVGEFNPFRLTHLFNFFQTKFYDIGRDMATVILDFDSTLISCESLEEILMIKHPNETQVKEMKNLTAQGMSGKITFLESLQKKLNMMPLNKQDFIDFGNRAVSYLTPGMTEFIRDLKRQGVDVWIVSGAVREAMLPVASYLNIPLDHVLGVYLLWDKEGGVVGIDDSKPINRSKWEGAQQAATLWTTPKIGVGDGMTDFALYEHKLIDQFIVFTLNARRMAVVDKGAPEAKSVEELQIIISEKIHG